RALDQGCRHDRSRRQLSGSPSVCPAQAGQDQQNQAEQYHTGRASSRTILCVQLRRSDVYTGWCRSAAKRRGCLVKRSCSAEEGLPRHLLLPRVMFSADGGKRVWFVVEPSYVLSADRTPRRHPKAKRPSSS